jgi:phospholipid/cholesterol/gamma-HCH transport system permease protein
LPTPDSSQAKLRDSVEGVGRGTVEVLEFLGSGANLLWRCTYWVVMGSRRGQRVRVKSVFAHAWEVGIGALPIVSLLALTIGIMLSIQGIQVLRQFGAEQQLVLGVSLSVTREFGPLITAILVAGRTGSALAARLATMTISSEVAALEVMGINPVRFLVAPSLVAMLIMLPALTVWSDILGLLGAGLYASLELGTGMQAWIDGTIQSLSADDVIHGLGKSVLFAALIVVVGVVNGLTVQGGAEGVGKVTTRSVVHAISAIVLTDMIFAFATTR